MNAHATSSTAKPSRSWYLLGLALLFSGCPGSLLLNISSMSDSVAQMPRAVVPGKTTLDLERGSYTGFYESRSVVAGEVFSTGELHGMTCAVTGPSGAPAVVTNSTSSTTYTFGNYQGESVFDVEVSESGPHELECQLASGTERYVVALGQGLLASMFATLGLTFTLLLAGIAALFAVFFKRRNAV